MQVRFLKSAPTYLVLIDGSLFDTLGLLAGDVKSFHTLSSRSLSTKIRDISKVPLNPSYFSAR
jgi:hypothetical protein